MRPARFFLAIFFPVTLANTILAEPAVSDADSRGALFGHVSDAKTGRPVPDCRVRLLPADTAVATDSSGRFEVGGLLPGVYRALFVKAGYEALEQANVVVGTGRAEEVRARLSRMDGVVELSELSARTKARPALGRGDDPAGTYRYGRNDVLRAPGALADISMFAQTIPGVARTNDQATDLAVRGGGPEENAFLVDGIPIFNINHFENNNRAGGGIGNINTYFLDGVDFHTGAFSARYPDRLSSVMDISFKRGNPSAHSGMATADVAGMGGLLEGPIPGTGGKSTYGATFRVSALTLLDRVGIIDFGAIPRYGNTHVKLNYLAGPWDISVNVLGGIDGYDAREAEPAMPLRGADSSLYALDYVEVLNTYNLFGGLRATRPFERGRLSLYAGGNTRYYDYREGFDRERLQGGPDLPLRIETREGEESGGNRVLYGADADFFLTPRLTLRTGLLHEYDLPEKRVWSTGRASLPGGGDTSTRFESFRSTSFGSAGLFGEAEWKGGPWSLTGGARLFYDEFTGKAFAGPRLAARRKIKRHTVKAAFGAHTQSQAAASFGHNRPEGQGELPYTLQSVLGWDADLPLGISTRLELFDKETFRLLRLRADGTPRDTGRTYSRGVDLFVRKALRDKAWGTASYTFSWNRERRAGDWRRHAYSVPHTFSTALGYDFSRNFTASVRLGLASGSPFSAGSRGPDGSFLPAPEEQRFARRTDPYLRLDTRMEYRKPFPRVTFGAFLEITNLTDEDNLFASEEYELEPGWGFLPIGGLNLSF